MKLLLAKCSLGIAKGVILGKFSYGRDTSYYYYVSLESLQQQSCANMLPKMRRLVETNACSLLL